MRAQNDWRHSLTVHTIQAYRTGWPGAWDAFRAALRRDQRPQVPIDVTFGVWIKGNAEARVSQSTILVSDNR